MGALKIPRPIKPHDVALVNVCFVYLMDVASHHYSSPALMNSNLSPVLVSQICDVYESRNVEISEVDDMAILSPARPDCMTPLFRREPIQPSRVGALVAGIFRDGEMESIEQDHLRLSHLQDLGVGLYQKLIQFAGVTHAANKNQPIPTALTRILTAAAAGGCAAPMRAPPSNCRAFLD